MEGCRWFHYTLVDADLGINAMMWQNAGKAGLDQWNFTLVPTSRSQAREHPPPASAGYGSAAETAGDGNAFAAFWARSTVHRLCHRTMLPQTHLAVVTIAGHGTAGEENLVISIRLCAQAAVSYSLKLPVCMNAGS